ncbi:MAG TPA: molybdopterin cofactor-binding domain-containing protein [Acidobacteriaceae bacterium]|nr:molybdopterin cofactor-binding domain-containing protein [Acidobacteriaceae bacterium]
MNCSRRDFLKGAGALVVSFRAASAFGAQTGGGQFSTHASHINADSLDAWLAIDAGGSVTAFTGKCDFGQGIYTAQTQLVAEELCVPLERVKLVQCDTAVTPDQGSTSGSQSTPTNFNHQNLALAAATAREALLQLASENLGEPVDHLKAENGVVTGISGQRVSYGDLIGGKHFSLTLNPAAKRRPQAEWTVLGKPVPSLDLTSLMTGQFEFVHYVSVPGMLHGRVVRPPAIGASLLSVDQASVKDVPGLVKVVVRKNFVGVVAETQYGAVQAARRLKVAWKSGPKLPPHAGFFDSLKEQPSRDALELDSKDVATSLAAAKQVVHARYTYPFQAHGSLGASCAVADVRANAATVWSATQSVYPTRNCVAMLLGMPPDSVRVIYTRGSGCYGLNGADAVSFEAAVMSQEVGRPVRLQFSRQDEMGWENYGNACLIEQRAALDDAGGITVWDRESWIPSMGSRPGYNRPGNVISGMLLGYEPAAFKPGEAAEPAGELRNGSNTVPEYMAGCIQDKCEGNGAVSAARVLTHTVRSPFFTGPLRSPLRIQNTFANECFVDELSLKARADPVEFRLKHLRQERLIAVLKSAVAAAKWERRIGPRTRPLTKNGVARGRGIACVAYEGRNGYAALVADVEVNLTSGVVQPRRFVIAIDCGPVSNPDGLRNQVEGGILQGTSRSLVEEITWDEQRVTSTDWESYPSLHLDYEVPVIETVFVTPAGVAATGAGETAITVTPAAIGNAIFDATGARLRDVPFTPARVMAALAARNEGAVA